MKSLRLGVILNEDGGYNTMKMIKANRDRDLIAQTIFKCGEFAYELDKDFLTLPDFLRYTPICTGCCDENDNIYLATRDRERPIVVVDSNGNYIRDFGKNLFQFIHSVFVTNHGTLLCADSNTHVIRELTTDGELIRDFGNYNKPSDSGYDAGIWRDMHRMGNMIPMNLPFQKDWCFIESIKTIKRAAPPFNRPTCAVETSKGDIFVSDGYANCALHKFSNDGSLLNTWGEPGMGPGKFFVMHSLWLDKKDRIWVADREGNSIQVFTDDGELIAYCSEGLYQPSEIWADDQYIYVGERGGITIFDYDVNVVAQLGFYMSSLMTHGFCGDSKGNLYIMTLSDALPYSFLKLKRL